MSDLESIRIQICRLIVVEIKASEKICEKVVNSSELKRIVPHAQLIKSLQGVKVDFCIKIKHAHQARVIYDKENKIMTINCPAGEISAVSMIWLLHYIMRTVVKYHQSLFVHCSAVQVDAGSCILLAGKSGAGKSTLSLHLARSGFPIIGTDLTLVNEQNQVLCGSSHINLYPDVLEKRFNDLFCEFVSKNEIKKVPKIELPIHRMKEKGYYANVGKPFEIKAVYIIQSTNKQIVDESNYYIRPMNKEDILLNSVAIDDNAQWSDWIEAKWLITYPFLEDAATLKTSENIMNSLAEVPHYVIYGDLKYIVDKIKFGRC